MRKRGSKVLIVVFIVLILIAISGGAFAYAYLYTDTFKTEQELFAKYLVQNVGEIEQNLSFIGINEIEEKLKQNKHEESMRISYTEAGKVQPNGVTTVNIQNDPINKKMYSILSLATQKPEETLKLEYMNENGAYSLRFTNAVQQFLTVKNSNLKQLATNLGMDEEIVEQIPDSINFEKFSLEKVKLTDDEKNAELIKYTSLLYNNISKEKYTKSKDVVITLNGKTITTNAYILTLNMQDIKNLEIQLLETLKQDEIILAKLELLDEMLQEYSEESVKQSFIEVIQKEIDNLNAKAIKQEESITITVYEQNKKTVRIKIEKELEFITIDTLEVEGKKQIDVNYTNIDENNTQYSNKVTFVRANDNKLNIRNTIIDGEEQQTTELSIEFVTNESTTKFEITFIDTEGGKTLFSRNINFVENIVYNVTLDNSNNIVLNELTAEQISTIFNLVGEKLNEDYAKKFKTEHLEPFKLVVSPMMALIIFNQAQDSIANSDFSEAEKSAFNSKFIVYEGKNISTAQVNALLSTVIASNKKEENGGTERYVTVNGVVILSEDDTSFTRLEGKNFYNVECKIGEDEFVNEIVIIEAEEASDLENMLNNATNFTLENMSYSQNSQVSIEKTAVSPENFKPSTMPSENITNTGNRVISILRTISTIAIVIMLVW